MADAALTWLGHGGFRLDSPGGKRIYLDPWLDNPNCPEGEKQPERIDVLALTHGHSDHIGNAVDLGKQHSPKVVAIFELANWLQSQGVPNAADLAMNKGGTVDADGVRFTMTQAVHSGGLVGEDGITYLGEPCGFVVELENGHKVYFSGDTAVFGDMQLIGRMYEPDVAVLPIGDVFTMGPREAAMALELLGVKRCIPGHYATFPLLTGTPDELRRLAPGVEVVAPQPGEAVTL
ncbi:MAG: metal-dependent hydrolase [Actinomycetota bacterium]|nr:metal-dependent hydrolase [Actinomycetota bacterium]